MDNRANVRASERETRSGPALPDKAQGSAGAKGMPQLLERTFAVLSLFTAERPAWTTTEIARECELPVPTVHRILSALHAYNYVARDEITKRFHLGPAALELGRSARASTDLRSASLPVLRRLSMQTGETALLTVLSDSRDRAACVERVESTQPLRLSVEPGVQKPLHAGASQKAILAYMPEAEIERIVAAPLPKLCRATVDDADRLRDEIKAIRARGWANSFEETDVGVWGLAMTLLDEQDTVVGAIGLAGPQVRLTRAQLHKCLRALHAGVEEIASRLALRVSCSEQQLEAAGSSHAPMERKLAR
jgi:IclR family acetate operon transcriptional repressor